MTAEHIIQIALLALIALGVWLLVWHSNPDRVEFGIPSETAAPKLVQPPPGQPAASPQSGGGVVYRVMLQRDGEWVPAQFVRDGSSAWQEAFDTPGMALQGSSGPLILGKQ